MKVYLLASILLVAGHGLLAQPFNTQMEWESYFKNRQLQLNPLEGIWSNTNTWKQYNINNILVDSQLIQQTLKLLCQFRLFQSVAFLLL